MQQLFLTETQTGFLSAEHFAMINAGQRLGDLAGAEDRGAL
jgi:hypothetical protein